MKLLTFPLQTQLQTVDLSSYLMLFRMYISASQKPCHSLPVTLRAVAYLAVSHAPRC